MLHELIDREDPRCLYCNSEVELSVSSQSTLSNIRLDEETLTCYKCKEIFKIFSNQDDIGDTKYEGFAFTCHGIAVYSSYESSKFYFKGLAVPPFHIDFSNKEKLYKKLRTYILFS